MPEQRTGLGPNGSRYPAAPPTHGLQSTVIVAAENFVHIAAIEFAGILR